MRSPIHDDGSSTAAAAASQGRAGIGSIDHRRSRSGSNGGSTGEVVVDGRSRGSRTRGGGGAPSSSSPSVPPTTTSDNTTTTTTTKKMMNGISPRGKRKDILIYSYTMQQKQQQQQQQQHQSSSSSSSQGQRQQGGGRSSLFKRLRRRSSGESTNNTNIDNTNNTVERESSNSVSSGGEQRHDSKWGNNKYNNNNTIKENYTGHGSNQSNHYPAWTLPSYVRLAPRMEIWNILVVSSCAAVASIGQTFASSSSSSSSFSSWDKLALSTCTLTFLSSLIMAIGVRCTPFRNSITKSLFWKMKNNHQVVGPSPRLSLFTMEFMVLTILSILWMISMPVIVNGNAYYSTSMDGSSWGIPLAVAGYEIWNANLFYSSWISSLLCGYLWIEVLTLHDRGGTIPIASPEEVDENARVAAPPVNAFTKRWLFLLCTALILMSSSILTYTSPVCQGKILKSTSYCQLALMGIIVGGVCQLLITLCVGLLYQLSHMSRNRSKNGNSTESIPVLSLRKRDLFTSIAAIISLIIQITNTALLTSPTNGGPGSISGTLYFASWMGFVLSFELCLRYLDVYSTASPDDSVVNARTTSEEDVTVYEDNDDAEDSDRNVGMNSSDEEKAYYRMGSNSRKQEETDVDNSQFFYPQPTPQKRRIPSPVCKEEPVRREPSIASSTDRSDPEGFDNFSQATPSFNDSSPSMDPEGVFGNSYFTSISMNSRKKDDFVSKQYEKQVPTTRMKEPEAMNLASQNKISLNKKKEERCGGQACAQTRRMASSSPSRSSSMKRQNLSPLAEGNTEDTSPNDISPETILGTFPATQKSRNNGRTTPTLQHGACLGQQHTQVDQTRSTKSRTSSRSSRSRSRENAVRSSYPVSSRGGSRSRHSTTPPQQKNVPLVSALSGSQRYSRSGSGGQSKSTKTISSKAAKGSNSSPDDSDSNPPPTISDATSSEEDMPNDSNMNIIGSYEYRGHPPPPPPPFQSQRMNSPPMQSIRTSMEGHGETDTMVSEPTLDAGLEDSIGTPSPRPTRPSPVLKSNSNTNDSQQHHHHHQSSSSVTSFEKKDSDDTNLLTRINSLSSDENISSNEGGQTGVKVVDDIVAAALAYAEMTHGAAPGSRGTAVHRGSGGTNTPASSHQHPITSTPQSLHRKTLSKGGGGSKKNHKEARSIATSGGSSSSIHSYYSKKRGGQHTSDSSGHPLSTTPVEDLLVKALSQARGYGHVGDQRSTTRQSIKSGISVESVYSEEETENSVRVDYDC